MKPQVLTPRPGTRSYGSYVSYQTDGTRLPLPFETAIRIIVGAVEAVSLSHLLPNGRIDPAPSL